MTAPDRPTQQAIRDWWKSRSLANRNRMATKEEWDALDAALRALANEMPVRPITNRQIAERIGESMMWEDAAPAAWPRERWERFFRDAEGVITSADVAGPAVANGPSELQRSSEQSVSANGPVAEAVSYAAPPVRPAPVAWYWREEVGGSEGCSIGHPFNGVTPRGFIVRPLYAAVPVPEGNEDTRRLNALQALLEKQRVAHIGRQFVGGRNDEAVEGSRYYITVHGHRGFMWFAEDFLSVRDVFDAMMQAAPTGGEDV